MCLRDQNRTRLERCITKRQAEQAPVANSIARATPVAPHASSETRYIRSPSGLVDATSETCTHGIRRIWPIIPQRRGPKSVICSERWQPLLGDRKVKEDQYRTATFSQNTGLQAAYDKRLLLIQ